MEFPKGSEWRRWDLHVHTPESAFANRFEGQNPDEKWEKYISCLESLIDVAVIGITDYFSIEGYLKILRYKRLGRLENIMTFLPNIEFRLINNTIKGIAINIHLIVDPTIALLVKSKLFPRLKFRYNGNDFTCTRSDLIHLGRTYRNDPTLEEKTAFREGANQFKVNIEELRSTLESNNDFIGKYLIVLPNSNRDGNSGLREENLKATREELYRFADCIFSGNPEDRDYFLGKIGDAPEIIIEKYRTLKPCIHGSDAHELSKICKPDLDRFTWIKADPTFEGLKQIIYEPEERVKIQKESPSESDSKTHFSYIEASGSVFSEDKPCFATTSIPLNNNMIAIIGGRGTGKSLLLDVIYNTFNKTTSGSENNSSRLSCISLPNFSIRMTKTDDDSLLYKYAERPHAFEYLHVRQGEVKEIAEDKYKLAESIKVLLGFVKDDTVRIYDSRLTELNKEYETLLEWRGKIDSEGNPINVLEYQTKKKENYQHLIDALTTKDTQDKIEMFISNSTDVGNVKQLLQKIEEFEQKIASVEKELFRQISALNDSNTSLITKITPINFETTRSEILALKDEAQKKVLFFDESNDAISQDLFTKGLSGDISGLLEKMNSYQQNILNCDLKLSEINKNNTRLNELLQERISFAEEAIFAIDGEIRWFEDRFHALTEGRPGTKSEHKDLLKELLKNIEIKGSIEIDLDRFYDGLKDFFDGRKVKKESLREIFPVHGVNDYFKLILNLPIIQPNAWELNSLDEFVVGTDLFLRKRIFDFYNFFYSQDEQNKYLRITPTVRYYGKEPHQLSVGQRGTFYVCLKLATSAFITPFIFDQPEDDLDNEFIVNELQPIFRKIKKYRQVIVVTHNANLVVNSDAEQVIVASNDNEEISFISGSLECKEIRAQVCRILEGGINAFKRREQRYGLMNNDGYFSLPVIDSGGHATS